MQIPERKIEEISSRLSIVDVVSEYVSLKKKGDRYWGLCPFHNEKTPSFSVTADKNLFYCFGCQKGGSIYTFISEVEHVTFVEAVEILAKKAGVELEYDGNEPDRGHKQALGELNERVAGTFHYLLKNHDMAERARVYLSERGIDPEIVDTFRIGYAPADSGWLYRFLLGKSYSEEFLAGTGLFSKRYPRMSLFFDRIMFPIRTAQGNVVGFGGRALRNEGPKYVNSPETEIFLKRNSLYGLDTAIKKIKTEGVFILVEGYFDVLAFFQAGILNTVAPLGTALTDGQIRLLHRYADRGLLIFDADDAGIPAAEKAILSCEREGLPVSIAVPDGGKDPAEMLVKDGPEALHNLIKYPINSFDYLLSRAKGVSEESGPGGKSSAVRVLFPYLESIESDIKREDCIRTIADTFDVSPQSVTADFQRLSGRKVTQQQADPSPGPGSLSGEVFLMLAVAANRYYFSYVRASLKADDFEDLRAKELYIALEDCFRRGEDSFDSLIARLEDQEITSLLSERLATQEFSINEEQTVQDSVRSIKRRSLEGKRKNVVSLMNRRDREGAPVDEVNGLLAEKMYLDAELEKLRNTGNG